MGEGVEPAVGRLIVAVHDERLRARIVDAARRTGLEPVLLGTARELPGFGVGSEDVVLLETGDDAALLVQMVYELYAASPGAKESRGVIGFLSRKVIDANPAVGWWLVDGRAAVTAVMHTDAWT